MKKLLVIIVLILGLSTPCFADTDVTFVWEPNSETDLAGYNLYQTATEGAYIFEEDQIVVSIPAGTETVTIQNVPDGEWWWVLTAFDTYGNESERSNEVTIILDTFAPGLPKTLNITVVVKVTVE